MPSKGAVEDRRDDGHPRLEVLDEEGEAQGEQVPSDDDRHGVGGEVEHRPQVGLVGVEQVHGVGTLLTQQGAQEAGGLEVADDEHAARDAGDRGHDAGQTTRPGAVGPVGHSSTVYPCGYRAEVITDTWRRYPSGY